MMKIKRVDLNTGASMDIGNHHKAKFRFADDGPLHVRIMPDGWVAVWDDRDDEAHLIPAAKIKSVVVDKDDLLAYLTAPDPGNDNVSGPARAATMAEANSGANASAATPGMMQQGGRKR